VLCVCDIAWQVCELDIIFNFEKAYFMLDELLLGGEVQESSKKNVLKAIAAQDLLQEVYSCICIYLFSVYLLWSSYISLVMHGNGYILSLMLPARKIRITVGGGVPVSQTLLTLCTICILF